MSLMDDSVSIVATAISLVVYWRASAMLLLEFSKISISGRSQGDTQFYLCQTAQFSLDRRGLGNVNVF